MDRLACLHQGRGRAHRQQHTTGSNDDAAPSLPTCFSPRHRQAPLRPECRRTAVPPCRLAINGLAVLGCRGLCLMLSRCANCLEPAKRNECAARYAAASTSISASLSALGVPVSTLTPRGAIMASPASRFLTKLHTPEPAETAVRTSFQCCVLAMPALRGYRCLDGRCNLLSEAETWPPRGSTAFRRLPSSLAQPCQPYPLPIVLDTVGAATSLYCCVPHAVEPRQLRSTRPQALRTRTLGRPCCTLHCIHWTRLFSNHHPNICASSGPVYQFIPRFHRCAYPTRAVSVHHASVQQKAL